MPKGCPKKNPIEEITPEEQSMREPTSVTEPEQGASAVGQTIPDTQTAESPVYETADGTARETQTEQPQSLLGYMAENIREDIRSFMQSFGINGHPPESVYDSIMGIADQVRGEQTAGIAPADRQEQSPILHDTDHPTTIGEYYEYFQLDRFPQEMVGDFISMMNEQEHEYRAAYGLEQNESPMEPRVPLSVRINSLELDGDTRAFATAEYGDLTVSRIRVKEDGYGTLSVNMPKYRDTGGWKETCRFDTVEAHNRLTSATLDAYQQKLAQLQGQAPTESQATDEAPAPGQGMDQEDVPDMEDQEQGGFGMSMTQC